MKKRIGLDPGEAAARFRRTAQEGATVEQRGGAGARERERDPMDSAPRTPSAVEAPMAGAKERSKTVGAGATDLLPAKGPGKGKGKGAGAGAALMGIETVDGGARHKRPLRAGVVAALLGFAVLAQTTTAQAQEQVFAPPSVTMKTLPFTTGPPPEGAESALQTRIAQLTAVPVIEARNPTVDAHAEAALARFQVEVERILRLDAAGLSSPRAPLGDHSALTPDQQKELQRALRLLVKELPVGVLAPPLVDLLKSGMSARGMSLEGLETRPLKDLGDIAEDVAKSIVDDFRKERPAGFYALAVSAAGALGTWSVLEGSDVLRKVGIRPEVKLKLFDKRLQLRAGAEWEARLKNPNVHVGLETRVPVTFGSQQLTGTLGVLAHAKGPTFGDLEANGFSLSSSLAGTLTSGAAVSVRADTFFRASQLESLAVTGSYAKDAAFVGLSATWLEDPRRFVGSLSAGYRPSRDVDLYVQGTKDSDGGSYVGIGARIRF
jgi:hypothetical protein